MKGEGRVGGRVRGARKRYIRGMGGETRKKVLPEHLRWLEGHPGGAVYVCRIDGALKCAPLNIPRMRSVCTPGDLPPGHRSMPDADVIRALQAAVDRRVRHGAWCAPQGKTRPPRKRPARKRPARVRAGIPKARRGKGPQRATNGAMPWGVVNWILPDEEVAEALGCTADLVRAARGAAAWPPYERPVHERHGKACRMTFRGWDAVDWSMGDEAIAGVLGYSPGAVRANRRRPRAAGARASRRPPARKVAYRKYHWGAIDWRMRDSEIARILGCSVAAVNRARIRVGAPSRRKLWESADWKRPDAENAAILGCSVEAARAARQARGVYRSCEAPPGPGRSRPCRGRPRHDWGSVDWRLSNASIARRLGCYAHTVLEKRRSFGIPSRPRGTAGRDDRCTELAWPPRVWGDIERRIGCWTPLEEEPGPRGGMRPGGDPELALPWGEPGARLMRLRRGVIAALGGAGGLRAEVGGG